MRLAFAITAGLALVALVAIGQEPAGQEVQVSGIACWGSVSNALLEIRPLAGKGRVDRTILRVGEKFNGVEVITIDPRQGVVRAKVDGVESAFPIDGTPVSAGGSSLNLRAANSLQVLELYQELSRRTLLRSGNLPAATMDLQEPGMFDAPAAARALESAFTEKGIALKPVGDKFVCAVRIEDEAVLDALPALPAEAARPEPSELLPAGLLKFQEADILQAMDVYQELAARTVLRAPLLRGKVTVRSQTFLTRAEAIWLMEAAVQLAGTRVVADGEKFSIAVPLEKNPPVVRANSRVRPENERTLPPGLLKFSDADPATVLAFYAKLCGRQAGAMGGIPPAKFSIRTQTSLTTSECLHGLDVLAALHGLEFVPVAEDKITLRNRPEAADTAPVPK